MLLSAYLSYFSGRVVLHLPLFPSTLVQNPFILSLRRQEFPDAHTSMKQVRGLQNEVVIPILRNTHKAHLKASAKILLNPSTRTTVGGRPPPADPATIANDVKIPSSPPKMIGLRKPPSDWCHSSFRSDLSSWNFLWQQRENEWKYPSSSICEPEP